MPFEREFWNQKILGWERDKYDIKRRLCDVNSSVKNRLSLAAEILRRLPPGKTVLELGCGSGRLWEEIKGADLKYTGVDFSAAAIKRFRERIQSAKRKSGHGGGGGGGAAGKHPPLLNCEDCLENRRAANIVVSLGLLDWLSLESIKRLAERHSGAWHLHSFSEKRWAPSRLLHKIYVFASYGRKTKSYRPRYYKAEEILGAFGPGAGIYRCPKLKFGAFIFRLPKGAARDLLSPAEGNGGSRAA